jgi:hypothetical protein
VIELVWICAELADDVGVAFGEADRVPLHRDDYALAAGADMGRHGSSAIATGVDSVNWGAVPPGIFDAAERTVAWRVEAAEGITKALVHVELSGPGTGVGDHGAAAVGRHRWLWRARRRRRRPERVSGIAAGARADPGLRAGATAWACRRRVLAEVLAAESDY